MLATPTTLRVLETALPIAMMLVLASVGVAEDDACKPMCLLP